MYIKVVRLYGLHIPWQLDALTVSAFEDVEKVVASDLWILIKHCARRWLAF